MIFWPPSVPSVEQTEVLKQLQIKGLSFQNLARQRFENSSTFAKPDNFRTAFRMKNTHPCEFTKTLQPSWITSKMSSLLSL